MRQTGTITAVLGPTNTGKTHYAIERMLAYRTGVIGLPLRLLAREVYDKIVAIRGPNVVALVTGEERIVPDRVLYWVCTVEAMPLEIGADFVAIDEIQLCADPERGHVFTDRLLHARGLHETLFLGADTMRSAIAANVERVQFMARERFSDLVYGGSKKLSRMPARSAIVGFSVENVYAMAELIRRQRGGCAVVMGALSPRTRNAQVELYQNGDVDFLVATDAIGMGLNLDIKHVAFSALSKFDGRRMRMLAPNELAQIAGRAGRYRTSGSFGVTGEAPEMDDAVAQAIMSHRFTPISKLQWRNDQLQFGTTAHLIAALEETVQDEWLVRARDADDLTALKTLADLPAIADRVQSPKAVRLLWDVCRIPDFRGIAAAEHASLLERIFGFLHDLGRIPDDWMARQIKFIDRTDGNIDTLSKRLAYIRTWTYVAQRSGWLDDESHWRGATRAVEDRLSDALHGALTQRFVDRRTSVLLRRLKQKESLVADVNDKGEVTVEGQFIGRLKGFRFSQDKSNSPDEAKTLRQAAIAALAPEFSLRADRFYNAPDTEIDFTEQGGLMWGEIGVGKLVKGAEPLKPRVECFVDEEAGTDVAEKVTRRLQHFIDRKIANLFEPLLAVQRDETLTGMARGFAFQMVEALGVIPRDRIAQDVKSLDQEARAVLRKHGIRFGQFTIFMPLLLKPAPTRLRLVLWALHRGLEEFPESPPPGLVTIPTPKEAPEGYDSMAGYRMAGSRAIRIDMLERLADQLRSENSRAGFEAKADMLSITGMTLEQFADLMGGLGYNAEKAERAKVKAKPAEAAAAKGDAPKPDSDADHAAEQPAARDDAPQTDRGAQQDAVPAEAVESPDAATQTPVEASVEAPVEAPVEAVVEAAVEQASETAPEPQAAETGAEPQAESQADPAQPVDATPVEMEVFYTFTWAPKRNSNAAPRGGAGKPRDGAQPGKGKPRGKGKPGGRGKPGERGAPPAPKMEARPPRKEKPIDPDNPFAAALMGLKTNK